MKSFPGSYPAFLTASSIVSMASSSDFRAGAKPPSSPTEVARPLDFRIAARAWKTSAHHLKHSLKLGAPTGMIINSCTSSPEESAWHPPFTMFIIGTGIRFPEMPPRKRYSGMSREVAAARQHAIETARIAFAPKFDLSLVPSAFIMALSMAYMSDASIPEITSLMDVLMFSTAFVTPFPRYLPLSLSLSSRASNSPVEAPLGAAPLPIVPSTR